MVKITLLSGHQTKKNFTKEIAKKTTISNNKTQLQVFTFIKSKKVICEEYLIVKKLEVSYVQVVKQ